MAPTAQETTPFPTPGSTTVFDPLLEAMGDIWGLKMGIWQSLKSGGEEEDQP